MLTLVHICFNEFSRLNSYVTFFLSCTAFSTCLQKIIGRKGCISTQKVLVTAEYANCKVDIKEPENDTTPFKFITSEGSELWDVLSALRYLARMRPDLSLYGRTFDESSQVDSWLQFTESNISIPLKAWTCWKNLQKGCIDKIKSDIVSQCFPPMENHLLDHTFLAGERLSIADINMALTLNCGIALDEDFIHDCPNIQRWFQTVIMQNPVKKHLCCCKNKDSSKQSAQPKPEGNKQEANKKSKKDKGTDDEDEDDIRAEENARAKQPNPLSFLPPSPLVLDQWKRQYSNTKDLKGVAMPWFWTHFDAAGWSIWYMRYEKMEGENTVGYVAANMLNGFFQRLDPNFRTYSFAVVNVVGDSGNFDIQGVWLLRGQTIPAELQEHPSFEFHSFRKLDPSADRALIEDYWCNDE